MSINGCKSGLDSTNREEPLFIVNIDVHTRRILKDHFSYTIKQEQVIELISSLLEDCFYPESIVIRSDKEVNL